MDRIIIRKSMIKLGKSAVFWRKNSDWIKSNHYFKNSNWIKPDTYGDYGDIEQTKL